MSETGDGPERDVLAALAEQHAELAALIDGLTDREWALPSRCEGWTVSDVVLHLAQTDELAIGSAKGQYPGTSRPASETSLGDVDEGVERMVAAERGQPGPEVGRRWAATAAELRRALAEADPHARVQWVVGDMSARTLATTRLSETWIHTGDVAAAFDESRRPPATDRLWHIARLAHRTVPYAFALNGRQLSGPVAFELIGPGGDAWNFGTEGAAATVIRGPALDLCLVAGRRADPADTALVGEGPDAAAVLELVRTYA